MKPDLRQRLRQTFGVEEAERRTRTPGLILKWPKCCKKYMRAFEREQATLASPPWMLRCCGCGHVIEINKHTAERIGLKGHGQKGPME